MRLAGYPRAHAPRRLPQNCDAERQEVYSAGEVAGDAALLAPSTDGEALAAAVARVLRKPGLASRLREQGFAQAVRFRWMRCAAETVGVYEETAGQVARKTP